LAFYYSQGQSVVYPWYYKLTQKIDRIQKKEFDSAFAYITVNYSSDADQEVKGLGQVPNKGEAILIGFKNSNISCIKIFESYDSVFRSQPITLEFDSILQNLRQHATRFRSETILPYVCEIYPDSASTIKGFYHAYPGLHTPFCCLYFKCATNSIVNEFEYESLNEISDRCGPNLNTPFNKSLESYHFYSFLVRFLSKHEKQFKF